MCPTRADLLSEILFKASIYPWATCADLAASDWENLYTVASSTVKASYEAQAALEHKQRVGLHLVEEVAIVAVALCWLVVQHIYDDDVCWQWLPAERRHDTRHAARPPPVVEEGHALGTGAARAHQLAARGRGEAAGAFSHGVYVWPPARESVSSRNWSGGATAIRSAGSA